VRTNKPEVRKQVLGGDHGELRMPEAEAAARRRPPAIDRLEGTDLVTTTALAQRMRGVLESALGKGEVVSQEPITGSEDFLTSWSRRIPGFLI